MIFTSDHGEWLGDHGLVLKGPMPYDGLLRIGLIARGVGIAAGQCVREPVSLVDIAPTLLDFAGLAASDMHGTSLRPLLAGEPQGHEFAYDEWDVGADRCGVPLHLRTVRTGQYRLTVELDSGAGELYDFARDPHECDNMLAAPAYAGVRRQLLGYIETRARDELATPLPVVGLA